MSSGAPKEDVPRLSRRAGDCILANEHNSTLLLGRDRAGDVGTGYGNDAGSAAAHLIVGRRGTDPNVLDDGATVYLSARSDPDSIAGTSEIGSDRRSVSAGIIRADCVRIVPRSDFKVSVGRAYMVISSDGTVVLEGEISLGAGASERVMKGESFASFWSSVIVQTPNGPALPLPPIPESVFSSAPVRVR